MPKYTAAPKPPPSLTRDPRLLQAVNQTAAALAKATHSETAVFTAFSQELKSLGLHGAISLLNETQETLVVRALVMPEGLEKAVRALEKIIGTQGIGYTYSLTTASIDHAVLKTNKAIYLDNSYQKLLQVFPQLGFLGRQALKPFSGYPGIVAPIVLDRQVAGVLYIAGSKVKPDNISAISLFANQLANALQEARLLQTIQQTEAQYRRLFETANDAILVVDVLTERIISANPKATTLTGYSLEQLKSLSLETLFPKDRLPFQSELQASAFQQSAFMLEAQIQRQQGDTRIVQFSATPFTLNERPLFQGFLRDITAQKHIKSLQAASYQIATIANSDISLDDLYRTIHLVVSDLMEAKNFYIALLDQEHSTLMLPYFVDEKDEYDGQPYPTQKGLTEYVLRTGQAQLIDDNNHERLIQSGSVSLIGPRSKIWLGVPLKNNEETFGAIVVQSYEDRDIYTEQEKQFLEFVSGQIASAIRRKHAETERAKLTAKLEQHVSMLHAILFSTPDYFHIYDLNGRFLFVSDSAAAVLGLTSADMIGKTWADLGMDNAAVRRFSSETEQILTTGESVFGDSTITAETGESRCFEYAINPVRDKQGQITMLVATSREITERKRAEEALRHTQKIESLGILAGGVAHDFNNLLVAMLGQTSLALTKLPPNHNAYAHIEKAVKAAERASELTKQLLAYSGRGQFAIKSLNINTLILENQHLLDIALPPHGALTLHLGEDLPLIDADSGQIQQVVMNLILNAAEALETQPGHIVVKTTVKTIIEEDEIYWRRTNQQLTPGAYVSITVTDNGAGMDAETLSRIFDPFYTTKFTGRGLGLAAVLGIVRGHHGGLRVSSQPLVGTTFELVFPVSASQSPLPVQETGAIPASSGIVLVIDDEAPVLEAVQDILEMHGIEVLTAANGRLGLHTYQNHQHTIDLVLLDWSMPEMNGAQTLEALVNLNPNVRVVLTSGYSEMEITDKLQVEQLVGYLQKPYSLFKLADEITRHLPAFSRNSD
ncbi:MAG: PAS domain S-box protein [Chloroflexota bacterium]